MKLIVFVFFFSVWMDDQEGHVKNWNAAVTIGGRKILNRRYTDDTMLYPTSETKMSEILSAR